MNSSSVMLSLTRLPIAQASSADSLTEAQKSKFTENVDKLIKAVEEHLITISNLGLDRDKVMAQLNAAKAKIKDSNTKTKEDLTAIANEIQKIYQSVMERMIETAPGAEYTAIEKQEGADYYFEFNFKLLGPAAVSLVEYKFVYNKADKVIKVYSGNNEVSGFMKKVIL